MTNKKALELIKEYHSTKRLAEVYREDYAIKLRHIAYGIAEELKKAGLDTDGNKLTV